MEQWWTSPEGGVNGKLWELLAPFHIMEMFFKSSLRHGKR